MRRKVSIKSVMKKTMSFMLMVSMCMVYVPAKTNVVKAAYNYNVEAAMSYAAAHWNDGVGQCAEFVSKCVRAGGLDIPIETFAIDCGNAVVSKTGVNYQTLALDGNGYATKALDGNILQRGDVVMQWCPNCIDSCGNQGRAPHIVICSGYDSSGYATYYGHNSALNGRLRLNSNSLHQYRTCAVEGKVIHISSNDTVKPQISNVKVTLTSDGYDVSCNVSDNKGIKEVKFPTWTEKKDSKGNTQDDIKWGVGTLSGGKATYHVKRSDHNNEYGTYITHIYAYDTSNNQSMVGVGDIYVADYSESKSGTFNGHKYTVYNGYYNLDQVRAKESGRAHLATITSAEENEFVVNLIKSLSTKCWSYYIGASDAEVEKTFKWFNGEPFSYTNWSSGQPDDGNGSGEDYVCYRLSDYKWNDVSGDRQFGYIMEEEPKEHTITFDSNGGNEAILIGKTSEDGKLLAYPYANKEGYDFLGWFTDKNAGESITKDTVFTSDTTVYAHWIARKHIAVVEKGIINGSITRYRYRDVLSYEEKTTTTKDSLGDEYEYVSENTDTTYGAWGGWSGWSRTSQSKSDVKDVATTPGIQLGAYYNVPGQSGPSDRSGSGGDLVQADMPQNEVTQSYGVGYYRTNGPAGYMVTWPGWTTQQRAYHGGDSQWQWVGTLYKYRTRSKTITTTYTYKKPIYGEWSDWSDTPVIESNTRQVEVKEEITDNEQLEVPCNYVVKIKADASENDMPFDKWEVVEGNIELADASSTETSFIMPDSDVKIKAVYKSTSSEEPIDDKRAAETVINVISDIGDVQYNDESKKKIDDARKRYDSLSDDQKKLVSNISVLTSAEATYNFLKKESDEATGKLLAEKQALVRQKYVEILESMPAITGDTSWLGNAGVSPDKNFEKYGKHIDCFAVIDLNNDNISELITTTVINFRWSYVTVYAYVDGEVKALTTSDCTVDGVTFDNCSTANGAYSNYICNNGHLHNHWSGATPDGDEIYTDVAYEFNGTELVKIQCEFVEPGFVISYKSNNEANRKALLSNTASNYDEEAESEEPKDEPTSDQPKVEPASKQPKQNKTTDKTKNTAVTTIKQEYTNSAPRITLKSAKNNKRKSIKVKWKWNVKADGYQLCYSTKKSFSGSKKKNISQYYDSATIKGLKKGKTYYVRIRSYVIDDYGRKVNSKWSKVKKVKIKK